MMLFMTNDTEIEKSSQSFFRYSSSKRCSV